MAFAQLVSKLFFSKNGTDVAVSNIDALPTAEVERPIIPKSVKTSSAGTTLIAAPTSGKSIRLWWYNISANPSNSANVEASLRFTTTGLDFYKTSLSQYGAATAHSFKAGDAYYQGGVNESLYLNLDNAQTVYVNIDYEEV